MCGLMMRMSCSFCVSEVFKDKVWLLVLAQSGLAQFWSRGAGFVLGVLSFGWPGSSLQAKATRLACWLPGHTFPLRGDQRSSWLHALSLSLSLFFLLHHCLFVSCPHFCHHCRVVMSHLSDQSQLHTVSTWTWFKATLCNFARDLWL